MKKLYNTIGILVGIVGFLVITICLANIQFSNQLYSEQLERQTQLSESLNRVNMSRVLR